MTTEFEYYVRLRTRQPIDLGLLAASFKGGEISKLDLFNPDELFVNRYTIISKTTQGVPIWFKKGGFNYYFSEPLEEENVLNNIKLALDLANRMQRTSKSLNLEFNPNILSLNLGHFDGDEPFEKEFGPIAQKLQKKLYDSGSVGYTQSSRDYALFLGTQEQIGTKQGILPVVQIRFQGSAKPADSLDELISRTNKEI